MSPSIIISTYNSPVWLEKVLWGYQCQTHQDFSLIIADDGSGEETRDLIVKYQELFSQKITHVWHEDKGFEKCAILNKAIQQSQSDYLIFTDGDCVPKWDFVEQHLSLAEEGVFLSGGYCKLPMALSKSLTKENITNRDAFNVRWLKAQGLRKKSSLFKLGLSPTTSKLADYLTPTKATWNGCNASTWKEYLIAVNGHNEVMKYGGEDREMGMRLINKGIKAKQIRNRALSVHLDHSRGYATPESVAANVVIREHTESSGAIWTEEGIVKGPKPDCSID